jgi:hypothetical protein
LTSHAKQFDFCADDGARILGDDDWNLEKILSPLQEAKRLRAQENGAECDDNFFSAGVQDCVTKFTIILFC